MVDLGREACRLSASPNRLRCTQKPFTREAELRLVADAEADRARRAVGELDVDRQFAVGVERLGRPGCAPPLNTPSEVSLPRKVSTLAGIVQLTLLEGHATLQEGRCRPFRCPRSAPAPCGRSGPVVDGEGDLGLARGVVDDDLALHRQPVRSPACGTRRARSSCAAQDGGRASAGSPAAKTELAHVDGRQRRAACAPRTAMLPTLKRGPVSTVRERRYLAQSRDAPRWRRARRPRRLGWLSIGGGGSCAS